MAENISTCLMLKTTLYLPLDLEAIIEDEDLSGDGIEHDTHITVFYKNETPVIDKKSILPDVKEFLGSTENQLLMDFLKKDNLFNVSDCFELSCFDNQDHYYLVMRLLDGNEIYKKLSKLNKGFSDKYGIESTFGDYKPHMTLAILNPGIGDKYLKNRTLKKILSVAKVSFDDLTISYGFQGLETTKDEYKQHCITTYHAIERHIQEEKRLLGKF